MNEPIRNRTTVLVLTAAILFGIVFWMVDSVIYYYFFREFLRFMVFERPATLLEAAATNISFHTLFVRVSFLVACAIGGVLTAIFINRRRKAEESLRESEERYRTLTENVNVAVYRSIPEPQGVFVEVNPAFVDMFGYGSKTECLSANVADLYQDPEDGKKFDEKMTREGFLMGEELQLKRKDGTLLTGSVSAVAIRDEVGRVRHYDGIIEDITERKQAEEELRKYRNHLEELVDERTKDLQKAQEELVRSERLATLGQFSGSISHELRNPLGTIDAATYYLKTRLKDADEKVQQNLDRIRSSVTSSTAIIESILNLTRMKEPQLQKLGLKAVVSDAIDTSKVPSTVNIIRDFPEREVLASGDHEQLRMAFKNTIRNAHEAMDGKGTLTVAIRATADNRVEVSFADTGPGIAPENLDRVFQPLFSTKAKGIGFGLSITKMIVDRHGGTIEARSDPGRGATIVMRLPLPAD